MLITSPRAQGMAGKILPDSLTAEGHRRMAEPGSADQEPPLGQVHPRSAVVTVQGGIRPDHRGSRIT